MNLIVPIEKNNHIHLMDENNYYNKYIKYKIKYLQLATITKSNININSDTYKYTNQTAGGYFYEQNDLIKRTNILESKKFDKDLYSFTNIYFKANLINNNIIKKYNKIRETILKNNSLPPHNYHLTLLVLEINLNYPIIGDIISHIDNSNKKRKIYKDLSFLNQDEISNDFNEIFKNMVLNTINYEILGKLTKISKNDRDISVGVKNPESNNCIKFPGSYFVDNFEVNNQNLISTFRIKFYERLNEFMKLEYIKIGGKEENYIGYRTDDEIDPDYILIFYDNFSKTIPFLAIKKLYYGNNNWTPHITIFNMDELSLNNMIFLEKYVVNFLTNQNKFMTDSLVFDELKKSKTIKDLFRKNAKLKITIDDIKFELYV